MAGIRHRTKTQPEYTVNGWTIKKRPISEHYSYAAMAWNAEGTLLAHRGFYSLNSARAFCRQNSPPVTQETP